MGSIPAGRASRSYHPERFGGRRARPNFGGNYLDATGYSVALMVMEILAGRIRDELSTHDRCVIGRDELARVWPQLMDLVAERNAAIHEFAKRHGWSASIIDPGVVVTFRKLKEGSEGA